MAAHGAPPAPPAPAGAAPVPPRRRPHDAEDEDVAPQQPAPAAEEEEEDVVGWDVWCVAQGVAAACVGAVEAAPPDAACVGAQPPGGAREARPARLLARGCGMPVGCGSEALRCPAELPVEAPTPAPPRPPPPEGWEYCGPEDDDLRPVGGWEKAPRGVPLEASLAAATLKAADASAAAARERVRAGLPIDEATFFPDEMPQQPQPQTQQQQKPPSVAAGQQAARGAQVLLPRGGASERAAARAAAAAK